MEKSKPSKSKDSYKLFLGNQKEGQGFADKRKRKSAYAYLKLKLKNEKKEKNSATHSGNTDAANHKPVKFIKSQIRSPRSGKKMCAFTVAEKVAKKRQEEKQEKKRKALQAKHLRDTALQNYRHKKQQQHLKMCKRTRRGQPVMHYQMEVLLDKLRRQKEGARGGQSSS